MLGVKMTSESVCMGGRIVYEVCVALDHFLF
jgi:hypothetical protein